MNIFIEDTFDSAHSLPHLPETHKCHFLHGHTYRIRLEFTGPMTDQGWIIDYGIVKAHWSTLKKALDHKFLNEIVPLSTAENITLYIVADLKARLKDYGPPLVRLARVEMRETERCGVVWEAK